MRKCCAFQTPRNEYANDRHIPTDPYNLPRLLIATKSLLSTPYRLTTPLSTAEISITPDWTEHQRYINDNGTLWQQDAKVGGSRGCPPALLCVSPMLANFSQCDMEKTSWVLACTARRVTRPLCKISWRLNSSKHSCHVWAKQWLTPGFILIDMSDRTRVYCDDAQRIMQ